MFSIDKIRNILTNLYNSNRDEPLNMSVLNGHSIEITINHQLVFTQNYYNVETWRMQKLYPRTLLQHNMITNYGKQIYQIIYKPSSTTTQLAFGGYVFKLLLGSIGLKNVLLFKIGIVKLSQWFGTSVEFGSSTFLLLRSEDNVVFAVVCATVTVKEKEKCYLYFKETQP